MRFSAPAHSPRMNLPVNTLSLPLALLRLVFIAMLGLAASLASAQTYPSRPIVFVSPFTPGSGSDLTARAIAPAVGEALGQKLVVENRAGAGGSVGARAVAKARPDGYTLLLASISFSVLPSLMQLDFDPVKDFEAITLLGMQPFLLAVPPSLPVNSIAELVALAKSKPGELNYATGGTGSIGHLQWELLKMERNVDVAHIPFRGTPEAMAELMSGRVHMSLVAFPTGLPQAKAGKVKALAVTGEKRAPELPDLPTMAEAGFPSMGDSVWYAVLAPAGTPKDIIARLNAAFEAALAAPGAVELLMKAGTTPKRSTPDEAAAYVRTQVSKWAKVAAHARIRPDAQK